MISNRLYLLLLTGACLTLTQPVFSQSISNTDNVITLNNTCLNGGVTNGTYNLDLSYYDLDNLTTVPVQITGVSVTVSGGVMTITAPAGSFPSASTRGWSLPDAWPGHIQLTSGSFVGYMDFFGNPDGTVGFNCIALPVYFTSFTGTLNSSHQVVLSWQTGLESNSTAFEIYRSSTGSNYYKIGQVAATGNSNSNYSFTDVNPDATNYYYLKEIRAGGSLPAIYTSIFVVNCSTCHYTPPTPVACSYSINGPDHICNLETPTAYTLSVSVPNYNTITWSIDQPSVAVLRTFPSFDRGQVTLLKKNGTAGVTLRAVLSGCTNNITRYIAFGTPDPTISTTLSCPTLYAYAGNSPGATNYEWHVVDHTTFTETITNSASSSWSASIGGGHSWNIGFQYTNGCGVSNPAVAYNFVCTGGGGGGHKIKLSPNPSSGVVTVGLAPVDAVAPDGGVIKHTSGDIDPIYLAPANDKTAASTDVRAAQTRTTVNALAPAERSLIYEVKVVDAQGVVRKDFHYSGGIGNVSVDLSGLINGIYTVQVFDNKTWTSSQVVLKK